MENNVIRVTKAQKFEVIKSLLAENATHTFPGNDKKEAYVFDHDEMVKFLDAEIALLAKKNTNTGEKKLTKDQQKNEEFRGVILAYLVNHPEKVMSATDVMEKILRPTYSATLWTNQKAAALLNGMCDKYDKNTGELVSEGVLLKFEGKGKTKTTFKIKTSYLETLAEERDTAENVDCETEDNEDE